MGDYFIPFLVIVLGSATGTMLAVALTSWIVGHHLSKLNDLLKAALEEQEAQGEQ